MQNEAGMFNYRYEMPAVTVDLIIFTIINSELNILLIERKHDPFKGRWALPGGHLDIKLKETLEAAARRELKEETALDSADIFLEQLFTFGDPERDPRGRYITVAYYALISPDHKVAAGDDAKEASWVPVKRLGEYFLAFDHDKIIEMALDRLKGKIVYTTIASSLLPKVFTLTEIQTIYEIILERQLDKRNFRRHIQRRKLVIATKKMIGGDKVRPCRPARLFRFNTKSCAIRL